LKQCLDDFQQTLFAIGADVYNRPSVSSTDELAQTSDIPFTPAVESMNGTPTPQFNFDFEDEGTLQADYEAIE
jgi:molecular chaperone DnaK